MTKLQRAKKLVLETAEMFVDDGSRARSGHGDWMIVSQRLFELESAVRTLRQLRQSRMAKP